MARDLRLTVLRRTLFTRRSGWALAAMLATLGILLGAQPLTRAADLARLVLPRGLRGGYYGRPIRAATPSWPRRGGGGAGTPADPLADGVAGPSTG
jgi:hypothetical protein